MVFEMQKLKKAVVIELIIYFFSSWQILQAQTDDYHTVPGFARYSSIDTSGVSVLPSGRFIGPAGTCTRISKAPFGLAVSPDGSKIITLHPDAITVTAGKNHPIPTRLPSFGSAPLTQLKKGTFTGIAITPDSRYAWISGGNSGYLWKFDINTQTFCDSINIGAFHPDEPDAAFLTDINLTQDGDLLVLDRAWQCVYIIDAAGKHLKYTLPGGIIPFGICSIPGRKEFLYCHVGIYNYPLVPGVTKENKDSMMLRFPPYGAHTEASEKGILVNNRFIPGLGPANSEKSMSVWMGNPENGKVMRTWNTGRRIGSLLEDGAEVVGGAHPCAIVAGKHYAYVSNAQNDFITVINLKNKSISREIAIRSGTFLDSMRGYMPYGLALDEAAQRLYVACMGFNAVAVINLKDGRTIGFIPTGWGPVKVVLHKPEGKLYITSARGYGAGPNGGSGFVMPPQGNYIGDIQLGLLQQLEIPSDNQLKAWRDTVLNYTFVRNSTAEATLPPIKHIVYITKENRTFDEVFGQRIGARGDSSLAHFGVDCEYVLPDSLRRINKNLRVAPNHHALADQFAISDNFYCDSDASIHGHHWMMGTIPNEYVETNAAYHAEFRAFSKAPGRRFPRTTGAMDPEDYNEKGGLWEALARHGKTVYNFGEANEYTGVWEEWNHLENGTRMPVVFPMPAAIYPHTCTEYAGYNTNIPDQVRVHQFEKVFRERWLEGKEPFPDVITIQLPNDHGADPRPEDGYPNRASFMADNDLALGRMIEFLSHTAYWNNMLVVVVEDDAQGGVDHIDAHRSLLMMAGPWVKPGYVSHTHANFGSVIRTIYRLLNMPAVNQYDATSTLLLDFLQSESNNHEFQHIPADIRVFDAVKSLEKYTLPTQWMKIKPSAPMDDEQEQRSEFYKNNR